MLAKTTQTETTLNGRKVIFAKDARSAITASQCNYCAFMDQDDEDCPRSAGEGTILICDSDIHSVWKYREDVPAVNPPEAPAGRKYDAGKPMYALMPLDAEEEIVRALTVGALRYNEPIDEENWRKVPNPYFRYYSAARRHMKADRKGELIDIDKVNKDGSISKGTDCYHLACAIASLMFMLQLRMEENGDT